MKRSFKRGTSKLSAVLAVGVVICFGAVLADTPPKEPVVEGIHFLHSNHMEAGVDTESPEKCKDCHSIDPKGAVMAPAGQGHFPCIKCHAAEFLVITEKNKQAKPQEFAKAAGFCVGCHPTVPWPWNKPTTVVVSAWRNQREHHIEMAKHGDPPRGQSHFDHTQMTKQNKEKIACRDCHVVGNDFTLATGTPGHAQCMQCHNGKSDHEAAAFAISECGRCHVRGSRENWLKSVLQERNVPIDPKKGIEESRPGSDVRECASAGKAGFDKKKGKKTPCFKHDTPGHRMKKDATSVQCAQCHFPLSSKKRWGGRKFESIADLHTYKIIGNSDQIEERAACGGTNDSQHAACSGGGACHRHKREVDLACPESNCTLCHANATSKNEPF